MILIWWRSSYLFYEQWESFSRNKIVPFCGLNVLKNIFLVCHLNPSLKITEMFLSRPGNYWNVKMMVLDKRKGQTGWYAIQKWRWWSSWWLIQHFAFYGDGKYFLVSVFSLFFFIFFFSMNLLWLILCASTSIKLYQNVRVLSVVLSFLFIK